LILSAHVVVLIKKNQFLGAPLQKKRAGEVVIALSVVPVGVSAYVSDAPRPGGDERSMR
jgi:hypothetical protein